MPGGVCFAGKAGRVIGRRVRGRPARGCVVAAGQKFRPYFRVPCGKIDMIWPAFPDLCAIVREYEVR